MSENVKVEEEEQPIIEDVPGPIKRDTMVQKVSVFQTKNKINKQHTCNSISIIIYLSNIGLLQEMG